MYRKGYDLFLSLYLFRIKYMLYLFRINQKTHSLKSLALLADELVADNLLMSEMQNSTFDSLNNDIEIVFLFPR